MSSDDEKVGASDHDGNPPMVILDAQRREEELDLKYPRRPKNPKQTLPYHVLYQDLFEPLIDNLKRKAATRPTGRRAGPHGGPTNNPHEIRRSIIERFITRWRREVGDDIFPAMRLIIPEKDRERAMYGLKEKVLARYLVKLMKIDKNSEDGFNLLNWKLPGQNAGASHAGDFAGRCYEVLCKRAHRIEPGNMTIAEVNTQLDLLSRDSKDETQMPIMEVFYKNMNADELTWLIRIILRNMKIGATERTILDVWHPDAEALFNVSSSLRRVCWELYDPRIRLEGEDRGVKLGECFQPQLAHQPNVNFTLMVATMKTTEEDPEFWIEEKLDGERMQLHINSDPDIPGGRKFIFWSRHGKDYSYLYGDNSEDRESAMTQFIKDGFKPGVDNAILDGEMITWNVEKDVIVPFGTLKTAAAAQKKDPDSNERPFYRVFDILLLNDQVLTRYTLRDRRKALEATVNNVHRRMELLPYSIGTSAGDIERNLREVVARASEGLVLKNPRSAYVVNARLHDWMKVKPEYMTEFGESLDCLIIGGYYGSGRRGGDLSSFLCGVRDDRFKPDSSKFLSLFKVGGGMTTDDYAKLRHNTEGKWHKYDPSQPPSEYIMLGGGARQAEKPDMWIKPEDSIVVEVKAASVNESKDYALGVTLRFPRFSRFRLDKNWRTALSVEEFQNVKVEAETKAEENKREAKMQMNKRRQKVQGTSRKKQTIIAGYDVKDVAKANIDSNAIKSTVFSGLTFYIMTECTKPEKKSKLELERLVKEHGGKIIQSAEAKNSNEAHDDATTSSTLPEIVCIAERRTVKVASVEKRGRKEIVKPIWLFDCIKQAQIDFAKGLTEIVVPLEMDRHLFFAAEEKMAAFAGHVDQYGDSYARDTTVEELKILMENMGKVDDGYKHAMDAKDLMDVDRSRGSMFNGLAVWFDSTSEKYTANGRGNDDTTQIPADLRREAHRVSEAKITARFAGARVVAGIDDPNVTHVVLNGESDVKHIRKQISTRKRLPRVVSVDWIEECWKESTRIDEERFAIV